MTAQIIPFPSDAVMLKDGHAITTSLTVAQAFGRQHKNVMAAIRGVECSEEFRRLNFKPTSYLDEQGRPQSMIELTEDGWIMTVMGFTGSKAARVKETYIAAFNKMRRILEGAKSDELGDWLRKVFGDERPRPELRAPRHQVANTIEIDQSEYIELLKAQVKLLKGERPEKPRHAAPVPLTDDEKLRILELHEQGMGKADIARELGRSRSAVRSVIRELATN